VSTLTKLALGMMARQTLHELPQIHAHHSTDAAFDLITEIEVANLVEFDRLLSSVRTIEGVARSVTGLLLASARPSLDQAEARVISPPASVCIHSATPPKLLSSAANEIATDAPRTAIRSRWRGLHKGNAVFRDDDLQASNSEMVRRVVISGIEQLAPRACELSFMR
jgi:hypothetical protein